MGKRSVGMGVRREGQWKGYQKTFLRWMGRCMDGLLERMCPLADSRNLANLDNWMRSSYPDANKVSSPHL